MKLNCIIIDDEPLARKGLREYIGDVDYLNCVADFDSPMKAAMALDFKDVQLLFLDIQMPKITGLDFLRSLPQTPPVIFTTAYPQYALDGFDVNALDYLVKPISFERFLKAAHKAKEYHELRQKNRVQEEQEPTSYFFIKVDGKLLKIFLEEVLYIEALQNYIAIHTRDKKHITYLTLNAVSEYLPADQFIKTHKSFIVPVKKVESIEGNELRIGETKIPISRTLKDEVMHKLLGKNFLKR